MYIFSQNHRLTYFHRLVKRTLFFFILMFGVVTAAQALGLGELRLKSALGQVLRADLVLIGADAADVDATCIRAKIETADGTLITLAQVSIRQSGLQKILSLTTRINLNEPVLKVLVNASCDIQLHREFLVLLDPPQFLAANIKDNALDQNHNEPAQAFDSQTDFQAKSQIKNTAQNTSESLQSANTGSIRKTRKNRGTQGTQGTRDAHPDVLENTAANKPEKKLKSQKNALNKDVLLLSDEALAPPLAQGLKISEALSAPSATQNIESLAELRQAQIQMVALLRGEKTLSPALNQPGDDQKILQKLQAEMAQIKKQSAADKAALEELKNNSFSQNIFYALVALSIFAITVIVLLVVYIRRLQSQAQSLWWEQAEDKKAAERRKNLEEIVNDVQASYEPSFADEAKLGVQLGERGTATPDVHEMNSSTSSDPLANNTDQFFQSDIARPKTPSLEDTNTSVFNFFSTRASSVKVEEISDVTQEAEFWMSVNDPHRAIEILDSQARLEHPDSPLPWLYLLDLYRIIKNKEKYDELKTRFSVLFNAHIPEFESTTDVAAQRHVDDMPHLMGKICGLWDTPEIVPFLQSLLVDDREGKRVGFELSVYKDLLMLIAIANEVQHADDAKEVRASNQKPVNDHLANSVEVGNSTQNTLPKPVPNLNISPTYFPPEVEPDLGMIEFEVIDFPHDEGNKK
jgi:hypothetical protein